MRFVLVVLVLLPVAALVVGGITGRVRARNCCSIPPEQDRRLQA
ncbi:MAG: hypothetical protein ACR2KE_06460 [Candidatus Nanopelagicales bacterium]